MMKELHIVNGRKLCQSNCLSAFRKDQIVQIISIIIVCTKYLRHREYARKLVINTGRYEVLVLVLQVT